MTDNEKTDLVYKESTQADLDEWNKKRVANLRPSRPNHWSFRRNRRVRIVRIALEWRKSALHWRDECLRLQKELTAAREQVDRANRRPFL